VILTHLCSKLWCWCKSVLTVYCPRLPLQTLRSCCLCFRSSASRVSLDGLTASSHFTESEQWSASGASLSRDRHCKTVLQSSCCSTETRDDTAYFQATTEDLAAPHHVSTNRRNVVPRRPSLLQRLLWFRRRIQNCRLTYLHTMSRFL